MMDEIVEEVKGMYTKMSLLELLAEENMLTALLYRGKAERVGKKLQEVLLSEIEKRLR
jgi:hypothetical protein